MNADSTHVSDTARAASRRLASELGTSLPIEVDAELSTRAAEPAKRFGDPLALAALIVNVAGLAWTIYRDIARRGEPSPEVVERAVRVKMRDLASAAHEHEDRVVEVVVSETFRAAQSS